jgi:hypothetical protein
VIGAKDCTPEVQPKGGKMKLMSFHACRLTWQQLFLVAMTIAIFSSGSTRAEDAPASEVASDAAPVVAEQPVAILNGRAITSSELDAYADTTKLPREEALEELIDLQLLKEAATAQQVKLPVTVWSPETRAGVELAVAQALGIEAAKPRTILVVDHAWLKDAEDANERATGRTLIDKLRALVVAGATIPEAFSQMQLDGSLWHIGDHEEYPYEIIPAEANGLPPGSISPVVPGDGGLHLFKIYQRKQESPSVEVVRSILRDQLRQGATIERP